MKRLSAPLLAALLSLGTASADEFQFAMQQYPPFNYQARGGSEIIGPMADVTMAVCTRIQAQCSIVILPWRRATKMAESGEIDGVLSILPTSNREAKYFFSANVMETAYSFFAPARSTFFYRQPKDLDNHLVAVYGPSGTSIALEELLKSNATARAVIEIDNITVLRKLAAGRYGDDNAVVAAMNRDVGLYLMKTEKISGIKPSGDFQKIGYSIGFSKARVSEARFKEFNDALKESIKDGTVRAILDRYGMRTATPSSP